MVNLSAAGIDSRVVFFAPREQGRHAAAFIATVSPGYASLQPLVIRIRITNMLGTAASAGMIMAG
ncbi:hypothetical protein GCM10007920_19890 [Ciceribacter naphthalenivorans]|uniref:Uncharacterized protein n=2 Tax=Alphaproteobacteria TaxID=28211 RepID=A0A512HN57_9HYPH|nr:hypothetical protein RNA01_38200 [Ciceribacter naphthalenivorans]GLR22202.1 hypothetical protein GCM10007920_19890 [Ciceribacter naphthalenivorans]GLT05058.1 hypothetical protein GCM10007926_19890 [Sphingomonas psychrolutea]